MIGCELRQTIWRSNGVRLYRVTPLAFVPVRNPTNTDHSASPLVCASDAAGVPTSSSPAAAFPVRS